MVLRVSLRATLRRRAPTLYRDLVRLRHREQLLRRYPDRLTLVSSLRASEIATVTVTQNVGMGGLLLNAATALNAGRQLGCAVRLRFAAPTYAPSWAPADWLDDYFVRRSDVPDSGVQLEARDLPGRFVPPWSRWGVLWDAISIRPEIEALATPIAHGDYAAVHYRGSDKSLEAGRVPESAVLDRLELEMGTRGLNRLFVASDEPSFIDLASRRFSHSVVETLPVEALASADGAPPHFADVPGEIKAREALATMLVLAGARVCVRTESYLSAWAETLADARSEFVLVTSGEAWGGHPQRC